MLLANGRAWTEVRAEMESFKNLDFDWKRGRLPAYIYYLNEEILNIQREAYSMYIVENGLGKNRAFPSLKKMENDVIQTGLSILGASDQSAGIFTSGGTESILLAVKAAREWAKHGGKKKKPYKILLSETAHPAFNRAAGLMEIEVERLPMREDDFKFDLDKLRSALDDNVIMIVGSAPNYASGTFDDVGALGQIASEYDVWLHVDACVGGFLAPFARMNGRSIPDFDLRVPGVRSLSADVHKYGFAAKGASLLLFTSSDDKTFAHFALEWARGTYQSESNQGTRAGGAVACAYAVTNVLGEDGYRRLAKMTTDTVDRLTSGINDIGGLEVIRPYELCIFAYKSVDPHVEINAVADEMGSKGWFIGRSQRPAPSIQMAVNPVHANICDEYLADLSASVAKVRTMGLKSHFDHSTY
ncbi:aminotransferase class V-fold PLP-dependent enzyme [Mesorhizobium sp. M0520]|uniref:pyridoxal phosphate-dependent decarboxylase family protein n=1 Tax=Mesorhizobium sp. M0520 TaxID=2956957 RepID=UPI003337066B